MSTIETRPLKRSHDSRDALEALDRPHVVGTDAAGCVHHHSPYDARVVVVDPDGSIARVEELGDRKLATWIAFVDDTRGWADLQYRETYAEILHEAIDA